MFDHLKDKASLSWRERARYFLAATAVVVAIFWVSLWMIAKAANFVQSLRPTDPIAVSYDANEDGVLLNEIEEEPVLPTTPETESPPP